MNKNILGNNFFILIIMVFCASSFFSSVNTAFALTDQIISVNTSAPVSAVYGDTFTVSATADSNLVVDITTTGGCSIDNGIVTMTSGIVACVVHYNQVGDELFNPATEVIETTVATKRPITLTAVTNTKAYDGGISAETRPIMSWGVLASGDRAEFREKYNNAEVGVGKILTPSAVIRKGNTIMNSSYNIILNTDNTGVIEKATPIVTWDTPANIILGTPISATQQNATASVPGTFVYTEVAGTTLPLGLAQPISVDFTPDDTDHYNNVMGTTVLINVIRGGGGGGMVAASAISAVPATPTVLGVSSEVLETPVVPATGEVLGTEKFVFTKLMKKGSRGNEVKELQNFLIAAGYNPGIADGIFGNKSKAALIKFQLASKLRGDGIVGPKVRALLNK
jgi:hypothetical protein